MIYIRYVLLQLHYYIQSLFHVASISNIVRFYNTYFLGRINSSFVDNKHSFYDFYGTKL